MNPLRQHARAAVLALLLTGTASAVFGQATVGTSLYSYLPGEPIVVSWQQGPGNPKDWIGIYPQGVTPGGPAATIWRYTDGSGAGVTGVSEGSYTFGGGLALAGDFTVYLLANDGYSIVAQANFRVVDPTQPFLRASKRVYTNNEPISIAFTNGFGSAKDWIGIYREGVEPGSSNPSLLWSYVDGTTGGTTPKTEGVINFASGLATEGNYVAHLLLNDGYSILVSEPFLVKNQVAPEPRFISVSPVNNAEGVAPFTEYSAAVRDGTRKLAPATVKLYLDGALVNHTLTKAGDTSTITYTNPAVFASESSHVLSLQFADDGTPAKSYTNEVSFKVATYRNLALGTPLYLETFENVAEGGLPVGWTSTNFTMVNDPNLDLQDLNSMSYADWVVVDSTRFNNPFKSYAAHDLTDDYRRVLSFNPLNIVNGALVRNLASGKILFGNSGYREEPSQYLILQTSDYDLTGKTNIHLVFNSLWEQNQDSIGSVEYSINQGATWLPVVYYLDRVDILTNELGQVDAELTLTNQYLSGGQRVATWQDPVTFEEKGGYYGAFIGAPISQALAPYLSARVDDNPFESKRIEYFRLPQADSQPKVRFRIAHAGTDSWYFGIDNFALHSITEGPAEQVTLAYAKEGNELVISWPVSVTGYRLEQTDSLSNATWTAVNGVVNNTYRAATGVGVKFYRLAK